MPKDVVDRMVTINPPILCPVVIQGIFILYFLAHTTDLAYLVAEERSLDDQLAFLNLLFNSDFRAQKIPTTTFSVTGI